MVNNDHIWIWFREASKPFHFSVEELCLLRGLKGQEPDKVVVIDDDSLILGYFLDMGMIIRNEGALNILNLGMPLLDVTKYVIRRS